MKSFIRGKSMSLKACLIGAASVFMVASPAMAQTYTLEKDVPVVLTKSSGQEALYKFYAPAGATNLVIKTSGGTGDADLWVNFGSDPTWLNYDCRPYLQGSDETCLFAEPQEGYYYISVDAYTAFSNVTLSGTYNDTPPPPSAAVQNIAAAGDSITRAFAADCTGNVWLWDLACLLGGDQPEHSWFDGWSSHVLSVHDKYKALDGSITANKDAATTGAEMFGAGDNGPEPNFAEQAAMIVAQSPVPDHVEVVLGGNDICNRNCTNPKNCSDPLYSDSEWRGAVRSGLNTLMTGLPEGGTVYMGSVARVQNLRDAGLAKEAGDSDINCQSLWSTYDVCQIVTAGGRYNGEGLRKRHAAVAERQQRYNEILREEAEAYNNNSNGQNPKGIEVVAEYVDENTYGMGTFDFTANDIDGGDCFHPNVAAQNLIADFMWNSNPDK